MAAVIQILQHLAVLVAILLIGSRIRRLNMPPTLSFTTAAISILVLPVFVVSRSWLVLGICFAAFLAAALLVPDRPGRMVNQVDSLQE